jgi:hypothetical protein
MGGRGLEPLKSVWTTLLQSAALAAQPTTRVKIEAQAPYLSGTGGTRTLNRLLAMQVRYQLRHGP